MINRQITRRTAVRALGGIGASLACGGMLPSGQGPAVTLESLLTEMTDRDRLARYPVPRYRCLESSSYDRRSVAPDKPGWFANNDWSNFIRSENRDGRTEWVMMDAEGPGAIVRMWMGAPDPKKGPNGTIRIYLDGAQTPVIEEDADKLLSGRAFIGPPLSAVRSIGRNLYLPIPFASRCKVTYDRPNYWQTKHDEDRAWYVINYRLYPKNVIVRPFSMAEFEKAHPVVDVLQRRLLAGSEPVGESTTPNMRQLQPGESFRQHLSGPGAVRRLAVRIEAADLNQALHSIVMVAEFDHERTIWCPAGDFFGSGVGLNPYRDWWRKVAPNGEMTCDWVMPYRQLCEFRLENHGKQPVRVTLGPITRTPWTWDRSSMYFHANWRQQYPLETKMQDGFDWNYIEIRGKGIYVGDTLTIHNGSSNWWGEGDEKIFVDGERFPSHFGTGTEDYYGYSFGDLGVFFEAPFHAQPRAEGNRKPGYTTNTRTRSLDAIPFEKSLKFDMEVWHWAQTTMSYAAAIYWYARPGATSNRGPEPAEAEREILS
jgi:hypothetical protein